LRNGKSHLEWGYKSENGPSTWSKLFPVAEAGVRQSPININAGNSQDDDNLPPLVPKFDSVPNMTMENTGASWKLNFPEERSSLTGGPLEANYRLSQIHAHWGKEKGRGSEHTMNGKMYDGEMHLVHFNTKYGSFGDAVDKPDGLAVLGVFLQVGAGEHKEFAKISAQLKNIKKKGKVVTITEEIDPNFLLPECEDYFTYPGSLTTPPLLESVDWLVYEKPIVISEEQMTSMRKMQVTENEDEDDDCECMEDNYRPVCVQGERVIRKSKTAPRKQI